MYIRCYDRFGILRWQGSVPDETEVMNLIDPPREPTGIEEPTDAELLKDRMLVRQYAKAVLAPDGIWLFREVGEHRALISGRA